MEDRITKLAIDLSIIQLDSDLDSETEEEQGKGDQLRPAEVKAVVDFAMRSKCRNSR
jgi:hypothetical protein